MYTEILSILAQAPQPAQLVAVSKTKPDTAIMALYEQGQRVFGENYVQELVDKQRVLPPDIAWHFIGHLQSNKVKYIAPFVSLIHGVDSEKVLLEIHKQGLKNNRVIDCLLQFHIAQEATKFGWDLSSAQAFLSSEAAQGLSHVRICGVMGMATFTDDKVQVRAEFRELKLIFDTLKSTFFAENPAFQHISMGMSDDFQIALEEGATLVRIGSLLFGKRNYSN